MAEAKVIESIDAPAQSVWDILSDFAGIKPGPGIDSVEIEGSGVGMVRTIHTPNGAVIERLNVHDSDAMTFAYAIVNDDSPLPFTGYEAVVVVVSNSDSSTTVEWTGTFEPRGVDEAKAVRIASGIYKGAIEGARRALA